MLKLLSKFGLAFVLAVLLVFSMHTAAFAESSSRVQQVRLELSKNPGMPNQYVLSALWDLQFGGPLKELLDKGVPLQFAIDFKLTEPKWYWFDADLVQAEYPLQLSYNALTRTYRLQTPSKNDAFASFDDIVAALSELNDWPVLRPDKLKLGRRYLAAVRLRLVLTELPKPFQVSALVNNDFDVKAQWHEFEFVPRREALR